MRVLLVEDEPTLARSIELMLRSETVEVVTVALGEEGLSRAQASTHDIILLDLNLPDMCKRRPQATALRCGVVG